jgi:leucyl aminopeptidase
MQIEFVGQASAPAAPDAAAVVVFEGGRLGDGAQRLEGGREVLAGAIAAGPFKGGRGRTLDVVTPHGIGAVRVLLVGGGDEADFDAKSCEIAGAVAYQNLKTSGAEAIWLSLAETDAKLCALAALGVRLAAYRFDRYRTREPADKKPTVKTVRVVCQDPKAAEAAFKPLATLADSIAFTRDLVSEPANVLYPEEFARRVKALESLGLKVEVLGEKEMKALGMGALLGVGQGSARDSQLAILQWNGAADPNAPPVAFVGKGVCFDSGGISIKPAEGMEDMKWDMGGAAAVAGLMRTLAARKAKVNAVGILGLVENMPDGAAQRPGDVVASLSGQTIEIINTDAEGRLVLGDALWYCQDRFKPSLMIDLATLTGAMIIAIGHDYGGLFCNNDELAGRLLAAGLATGDKLWRMPLEPAYDKQIESAIADVKNTGGRPGGSITAALFLQKFVRDIPWAHLDIAPIAWKKPSMVATIPEGATGFGVRLLDQLVADHYES